MVKRSRSQSQEAPSRLSWWMIVPPYSSLPLPDPLDELLAAEVVPVCALLGQLALDHVLGGDAGVVGAGHPERVVALHALPADEDVLERVVQRVAHVQDAGDVGRRDDDGVAAAARFAPRRRTGGFLPRSRTSGVRHRGVRSPCPTGGRSCDDVILRCGSRALSAACGSTSVGKMRIDDCGGRLAGAVRAARF